MFYLFLDTCVLLDISTKRSDEPLVSALEELCRGEIIKLIIADLVFIEYERNKESVANKAKQRLTQEFKQVHKIVKELANEQQEETLEVLNDISSRLPLLTDVSYSVIHRVEELMRSAIQVNISERSKIAAIQRALSKKAPFHQNKNSIADALLVEQFFEFMTTHDNEENYFLFITHNHNDFSAKDHRKPHEDFDDIFSSNNAFYFNNLLPALNHIDEDVVSTIEFEHDYTEETRGLREILDAMDELVDKIWYNRHQNRMYFLEKGDIEIVPSGTKRYGNNVIHEDVLQRAIEAAQKVEEKYEDVGPWSDFEWGMINGKLSALRWVLGDDWDMLDT